MNRYARLARDQWERFAPARLAALPDPDAYFSELGELVDAEVSGLTAMMLSRKPCSGQSYLDRVAELATARRTAEEVVMARLVWIRDPDLPLAQAREEWDQTRPSDENLIMWADRMQDAPDVAVSTDELEQMALEWAVPVSFLEGLLASEPPREYARANQAVLAEAASIRFLRELH